MFYLSGHLRHFRGVGDCREQDCLPTGRRLTAPKIQDHHTFEKPGLVKPTVFKGTSFSANQVNVKLPPFSVADLELK